MWYYPPDFDAWLKDFPSILIWLEGPAAPWMVSPDQLRAEGGVPKADVPAAPLPSVNQTLGEAYLGLIPDRDRYNEEVALAGLAPIVAWLELAREGSAGDAFNAIVEQRRLAAGSIRQGVQGVHLNLLGLFLRTSIPFTWRILSACLPS
jgi:hypothetical protein